MSIVSKASLKNDFLTDKVITQDKMEDLIDSCYNVGGTGSYGLPYEIKKVTKTWDKNELLALCAGNVTEELIPAVGANEAIYPIEIINFYNYGASTNPFESQAGGDWEAPNGVNLYFTNQFVSNAIWDLEGVWGGGGAGLNVAASFLSTMNDFDPEQISNWQGSGLSINVNIGITPFLVDTGGGNVSTMTITIYYRIVTDWQF